MKYHRAAHDPDGCATTQGNANLHGAPGGRRGGQHRGQRFPLQADLAPDTSLAVKSGTQSYRRPPKTLAACFDLIGRRL